MDERNIRIPVDLKNEDKKITLKIEQEFDNLEVLSLKISSTEAYSRMCSDFGVIVGRVMLNSGFGVQNAKINVFVPITEADKARPEIIEQYPFETVNDTYPNGVRYNLLPRVRNKKNPSHRAVGNFPHPDDFAHYPQLLEITDKYYKYTTTTNESGDYMIFGVPLGQRDIVMDFDLFDTTSFDLSANDLVEQISLNGSVAQLEALLATSADPALNTITGNTINPNKVPNFIYKGYNNYEVEVKANLDEMVNIFHEVKQVTVSPFWGDDNFCDVGITRCDFKINFKYTPTALFFGYIHAPSDGFSIDQNYNVSNGAEIHAIDSSLGYYTGDLYPYQKMEIVVYRLDDQLNRGSRKRLGVFTGSYYNGIFRLSLPMYMDYYITNEFGDLVPTTDVTLGIPTKSYYAFEIYDTDDKWTNRRTPLGTDNYGGFTLNPLPGIRIPSTTTGDQYLGGWEGTWGGLFEYDLLNRKRKYYTVKTIHSKHSLNNVRQVGNYVAYFPSFNPNKASVYWNFPISVDDSVNYDEPTIIGSVLVPRVRVEPNNGDDGNLKRPYQIVTEPWISADSTFGIVIQDCEIYLGLGVKRANGINASSVFADLFSGDNFYYPNTTISVFGDVPTWNYGDNSTIPFVTTLFAIEKSKVKGSKANGFGVHPAYNQVVSDNQTYGVFINCLDSTARDKHSMMEILIYDVTDELPDLIKDQVYSSYQKGINNLTGLIDSFENLKVAIDDNNTEIYVEENGVTTNQAGAVLNTNYDINSYKGKFYYFGTWKESNALYDIEQNYFIK